MGDDMITVTIIGGIVQIVIKLIEKWVPDKVTKRRDFHMKRRVINKLETYRKK